MFISTPHKRASPKFTLRFVCVSSPLLENNVSRLTALATRRSAWTRKSFGLGCAGPAGAAAKAPAKAPAGAVEQPPPPPLPQAVGAAA